MRKIIAVKEEVIPRRTLLIVPKPVALLIEQERKQRAERWEQDVAKETNCYDEWFRFYIDMDKYCHPGRARFVKGMYDSDKYTKPVQCVESVPAKGVKKWQTSDKAQHWTTKGAQ